MEQPSKELGFTKNGDICDEWDNLILAGHDATRVAIVRRYNAHAAREQVLADVAELATQLARSLTNYNEAYALVRQMRAVLKKAREA
jgi:hypothetical protein